MTATARKFFDRLRESYWFVPAIMAVAALLLASGMVWLDGRVGSGWMDHVGWLYAARPAGARSLLSSIGGSMVTVAGTVFSVTIAAVVYASGQYGPRLLSNFMEDRGNQVTLGTFISTFLYCMVVLRTIRSPGEGGSGDGAFVPQLSLLVGVGLMLASVAVLIYFVHHVPTRIHINNVIERIGRRLLAGIDQQYPRTVGHSISAPASIGDGNPASASASAVSADETGYVQLIDEASLIKAAVEHDCVVIVRRRPGEFVHAGDTLAELSFPGGDAGVTSDAAVRAVRRAYAVGARRSPTQDLAFLIDELGEIAARALSPGVNDPFTAMTCLDWLGATFAELAERPAPSRWRADRDGAVRLDAKPVPFAALMAEAFGRLAPYAADDRNAALRFIETLARVAARCRSAEYRSVAVAIGGQLTELAEGKLTGEPLRALRAAFAKLNSIGAG